jgi:hypothetical protein
MKRLIIAVLLGALGGGVAGFGAGILVFPYWFLSDVANETLAADVERTRLAVGEFVHVNPLDPIHWGKGHVSLHREGQDRTVLHLEEDFEVGPGPRFHVYLVDRANVESANDFIAGRKVDLGRLRAFKGSQVYSVPPGIPVSAYQSVVVWCKEFDVLISPAKLAKQRSDLVSALPN